MNLTLINVGPIPLPIIQPGTGNTIRGRVGREARDVLVDVLEPGAAYELADGISVVIIGDKPSVREQFERAHEVLSESAKALLEAYQNRTHPNMPGDNTETVAVTIQNNGRNAVRVILGDGVTDYTVAAGAIYDAQAQGYLELRELGLVNPNLERQPSSAA